MNINDDDDLKARITVDSDGVVQRVNRYSLQWLGYMKEDIVGKSIITILPSPFHEELSLYVRTYMQHFTTTNGNHHERSDDDWRDVRIVEALHSSGVIIPLRLRMHVYALGVAPLFVARFQPYRLAKARVSIDRNGVITKVNDHVKRVTGYARDECIGENVRMFMCEPERSEHDEYLKTYHSTAKKRILGRLRRVNVRHKKGTVVPMALKVVENEMTYTGTFYEEQDVECMVIVEYDSLQALHDAIIVSISHSCVYLFGYTSQQLIGCAFRAIVPSFGANNIEVGGATVRCEARKGDGCAFHVYICAHECARHSYHVDVADELVTPCGDDLVASPLSRFRSEPQPFCGTYEPKKRLCCSIVLAAEGFATNCPFPQVIDQWRFEHVLAVGGFARVFYATSVSDTSVKSAVKCFNKEELKAENMSSMVSDEMSIMKRLGLDMRAYRDLHDSSYDANGEDERHRIPRVLDVFETNESMFLCQEYINGSSLQLKCMLSERGRFSERTARMYFRELVNVVAFMHGRRVAHRDLKLSNVMIDSETDEVYLIDYGLSSVVSPESPLSRGFYGSVSYIPPEIVQEIEYCPIRGDMWSLGVCLVMLLSGDEFVDLVEEVSHGHLDEYLAMAMPCGSPQLLHLVHQLLNVNPSERPSIFEVQSHEWFTVADTQLQSPSSSHTHDTFYS